MIAQLPNVRQAVRWNRAFLRRVVRYLIREAGIRQIIDVGAGLPTAGNTHEVALEASPRSATWSGPSTRRRPGLTSAAGPRSGSW
jgi:S-adenosyl methyltransferase